MTMWTFEWKEYDYSLQDLTDQVIAAKRSRKAEPTDLTEEEWRKYLHKRGAVEVVPLSGIVTIA
jgi:hypothetical protein